MAIHTFAAVDVGSYELGLKIFEISRGKGIREVDHLERRIDLGSDTFYTGKISHRHVLQVGEVLRDFHSIMETYRCEDYKAYGTSAIREMTNASLVLRQWEQMSGIHVDVISNSEQRFLDYKSVASRGQQFNDFIKESCAIVDIGGGSLQISWFDEDRLSATQNMPLGVLRLYDRVRQIDARTDQFEGLVEEIVGAQIETFKKLYLGARKIHNLIIIDDHMSNFMQSRGMEIVSAEKLQVLLSQTRESSLHNIGSSLGLSDEALNLLYITGIMVNYICRSFGADKIWGTGVTLCDGIAYEYAEKHRILPPSHDFDEDILACTSEISKRYMGSETRSDTLENIATKIFDATKKIHGMGAREKLLLRISARLHDCGKYISMANIGECGYDIIMATEIIGLSHKEREIVANVVRYNHSEFVYYEEQENVTDLDLDSYMTITNLTAILQLANGLDRSHKQKFGDIRIQVRGDKMVITVRQGVDITLEKGMIKHRADFFEEVLGLTPVIRQSNR